LLQASLTIGVSQLVRVSWNAVEAQKGSQRHPSIETIVSGVIMALSIVSDLLTDAANREPCCLFHYSHLPLLPWDLPPTLRTLRVHSLLVPLVSAPTQLP
jgi:hypothetical protein